MSSLRKWIVRGFAIAIAVFAAWAWFGFQHMDDGSPPSSGETLVGLLRNFALMAMAQLGLFLSPSSLSQGWRYRLLAGLLMAPTFLFTIDLAIGHLEEIAVYGPVWLRSIYSVWIPVLTIYIWQYASLLGARRTSIPRQAAV